MLRMFDFKCEGCGAINELIVCESEVPVCKCGAKMDKLPPIIRVNMGASGAHGYYDDNLQTYIHTNAQRREEMKKQGVSEKIGQGWY